MCNVARNENGVSNWYSAATARFTEMSILILGPSCVAKTTDTRQPRAEKKGKYFSIFLLSRRVQTSLSVLVDEIHSTCTQLCFEKINTKSFLFSQAGFWLAVIYHNRMNDELKTKWFRKKI